MKIKNFYDEEIEVADSILHSTPGIGQCLYIHAKNYPKNKLFLKKNSSVYHVIGEKGFAVYDITEEESGVQNLQIKTEIRYDECDFIDVHLLDIKSNGIYTESTFTFCVVTKDGYDSRFEISDDYNKKAEIKKLPIEYLFGKKIEEHLTVYFMRGLINTIDAGGYYDFRMLGYVIRLSKDRISFVKNKSENIYKFDQIKSVYSKGTKLFIEDKDFQKKIFKITGQRDKIDINLIVNRRLFLQAFSKYSGYNI